MAYSRLAISIFNEDGEDITRDLELNQVILPRSMGMAIEIVHNSIVIGRITDEGDIDLEEGYNYKINTEETLH